MKNIIILLVLFGIESFAQEYLISENEYGVRIELNEFKKNDSIDLPNYLFKNLNKDTLRFKFAFETPNFAKIKINNNIKNYQFEFFENFRDVDIYNIDIPISEINNNSVIEIEYDNKLNLSKNNNFRLSLFSNVLNKKHLSYILANQLKNIKSSDEFLDSDWFTRNKKYLKFETRDDKIYRLNTDKIIEAFGNVNINKIKIDVYGESYKYFYVNSDNNILDENDEIFLLGKTHRGDSTYYEHYNVGVPFFISISESDVETLAKIEPNQKTNEIQFVNRKLHFEKDSVFSNGYDYRIVTTDKNYYEGWYYQNLDATNRNLNSFELNLNLYPHKINSAKLHYTTFIEGFPDVFNIYNLNFYQNNNKVDSVFFTGFKKNSQVFNKDYVLGNNSFKVVSELFINNKDKEELGRLGIDFLEIEGEFYPIAENGLLDFEVNSQNNSFVEVHNFNDNVIVSIDTLNLSIELINAEKKSILLAEVLDNYSSLTLNDKVIYGDKNYNIIYLDTVLKSLSTDNLQDILNALNTNPITFALLNNNIIEAQLKTRLSNFGFNVNNNKGCYLKVNNELKSFDFNSNNFVFDKFNDNNLNSFSGQVSLNNGLNSKIVGNASLIDDINEVGFTNLKSTENQADIIYITSKVLAESVDEYLEYRVGTHPDLNFKLVFIEDIYNEFSYGLKGPHSVKEFLKYAFYNWSSPKFSYLYLIGETSWDPEQKGKSSIVKSIVPTFGFPVSDVWYADLDESNQTREEIYVSRITPNNNQDVLNYLEKLKEFEKVKYSPWLKKMLLLVGGAQHEKESFLNTTNTAFRIPYISELKIDTTYVESIPQDGFEISRGEDIRREINNGVLWTNFLGHGSTTVFDMDGWAENQLNNFGRTGILSTLSCNTNAFGESFTPRSRNESYIMYPKTGFIFTYGGTTLGVPGIQILFMTDMMKALSDPNLKVRNVMELKKLGTQQLQFGFDIHYLTFNTLGDPLINIPLSINSDFYFLENDLKITNEGSIISVNDSVVNLSANIFNNGFCNDSTVILKIEHNYGEDTEIIFDTLSRICRDFEYNFELSLHSTPGIHSVKLSIDSENFYFEDNEDNNDVELAFNVFNRSLIPIDPKNNWNVSNINPTFRFYDANYNEDKNYSFKLIYNGNEYSSIDEEINIKDKSYVTWEPNVELPENIDFELEYEMIDNSEDNIGKQILNLHTKDFQYESNLFNYDLSNLVSDNIYFDSNTNALKFKEINYEYNFTSINGKFTGLDNHIFLKINGEEILANRRAASGSYILIFDRNNLNFLESKFFYTFSDVQIANDFIGYIKDSLDPQNYNFILITGSGLNAFSKYCGVNDACHLDSLKLLFKDKFNSTLIDSIYNIDDNYMMVYSKYENESYFKENFVSNVGDSVALEIKDNIIFPIFEGKINIPIPNDNYHLDNISLVGEQDNAEIELEFYDENNISILNYSNISFNQNYTFENYDVRKIEVTLKRNMISDDPKIQNILLKYKPFPELGLVNQNINYDSVMRADDFEIDYRISNYSLRSTLDSSYLNILNNAQNLYNIKIEDLKYNTDTTISFSLETDNLANQNNIISRLNQNNLGKELINNDNIISNILKIFEDREAPIIEAFANSKLLFDQAFISETSTFTIYLYDNSNLKINDKSKFTRVRLNGWINDEDIMFSNTFTEEEYQPNLKASIKFTSNNLELGEANTNLLEVTAQDATGNETSIQYYLNITRKNNIDSLVNYPNPFVDNFTVRFNYKGSVEPVSAEIMVYDNNGKMLFKEIKDNVIIGQNEYNINLSSYNREIISKGNYILVVKLESRMDNKNIIIQKSE